MSAPGLMHYFPEMQTLLAAVLDARDEEDLAALRLPKQPDARLLDLIDSALAYYAQRPAKVAQFDTLEIEALDPQHPAHDYFVARNERTFELMTAAIEREFDDPVAAAKLIRLLFDGMRLHALRDPESGSMLVQWQAIREVVAQLSQRSTSRPGPVA